MPNHGAVLFIEDDPGNQQFVWQALQDLSTESLVETTFTGEKAITCLQTNEAPLSSSAGYRLPGMDGVELRRRLEEDHLMLGNT